MGESLQEYYRRKHAEAGEPHRGPSVGEQLDSIRNMLGDYLERIEALENPPEALHRDKKEAGSMSKWAKADKDKMADSIAALWRDENDKLKAEIAELQRKLADARVSFRTLLDERSAIRDILE